MNIVDILTGLPLSRTEPEVGLSFLAQGKKNPRTIN